MFSPKLADLIPPLNLLKSQELAITDEQKAEFERLHTIVETGVKAFWEIGQALGDIKKKELWRAGEYKSWKAYCRSVAGISRIHAHRLMQATAFMHTLQEMLPQGNTSPVLPMMEAQVRPILRLPEEKRVKAWETAVEKAQGQQPVVKEVKMVVSEIL